MGSRPLRPRAPDRLRAARGGALARDAARDLRRRAHRARGRRSRGRHRSPRPRPLSGPMLACLTDPFASPIVVRALAAVSGVPLVLGALAGVLLAAAGIALVAADRRLSGDVGVAVCVSDLLGLGGMLALSADTPPRLQELLFGDLLGVGARDLLVAGALAGGVVVALAAGHRRLALVGFDRGSAAALGAAPARWELALLAILAVTTVAAAGGLGNLLLVALVLAPAAAALALTRRLLPALGLAVGFGALSGLGGLIASYHFEIAAGASVALCAVACAGFALLLGRTG